MNDFFTSVVRTVVPLIAGVLITAFARMGIEINGEVAASLVTSFVSALYYAGVRWLETLKPKFGWLLGKPKAPKYQ